MLYYIIPLIYNDKCDWYKNYDEKIAVYLMSSQWYHTNWQDRSYDEENGVKLI